MKESVFLQSDSFPSVWESWRPTALLPAFPTPARIHISKGRIIRKLKKMHDRIDGLLTFGEEKRDQSSSSLEKKWNWCDVDWVPFKIVWLISSSSKMISLIHSSLVMSHVPTFSCLFSWNEFVPIPLCPCCTVVDTHHFCIVCHLLPPSPSYSHIFKSKNPSKLTAIAILLFAQVLNYSRTSQRRGREFFSWLLLALLP